MIFDTVIRGSLVLPEDVQRGGWLGIQNGSIEAIGEGEPPDAREMVTADGLVLPGVVDGQTHAGSIMGFGGLEDLTRSAAAGGVTTIVDMPFDEPNPVTTGDLLREKAEVANRVAHTDVALYGSVKPEVEVDEVARQADAGACAFKMSTYHASKRFPRVPHPAMERAFAAIAETGLSVAVHNEDQELVDDAIARFKEAGKTGANDHHPTRPPLSELLANAIILEIGAATGARAHIVHSSLARGFDMARSYRDQGHFATAETCLHYLIFDEADVIEMGARGKVNPPIRPDQKEAIWEKLLDGDVAFVSSDHCSWPLDRKPDHDIFQAAPGAHGVECLLPALADEAVLHRGLRVEVVVDMLCESPARHFGLYPKKGVLKVGADADIVVLREESQTVDETKMHCELAPWSPYHGREIGYRVGEVWLRGTRIFDGTDVVAKPGTGRFVRPS